MYGIKHIFCLLCLASMASVASGTDISTPMGLEMRKTTDYAVSCYDPALMWFADGFSYADLALSAEYEYGGFHRPQAGSEILSLKFDANGAERLGRFFLDGGFRFRQGYENGVGFASTFNPFRGTPYYIADSTGGDWTKQSYDLWANVAFDAVRDRLSVGLGASVSVGRGAKQTDPRPQANTNTITLTPSLAYSTRIGIFSASMICTLFKETSNLILYDSSRPQKLYLMKGVGQYTYEVFSNTERERQYDGDAFGLSLGYMYDSDRFSVALGGKWTDNYESAYDIDYNKPHVRGKLYSDICESALRLSFKSERLVHNFALTYTMSAVSGREVVQTFDSSPDVNSWVTDSEIPGRYLRSTAESGLSYDLWILKDGEISWKFCVSAGYDKHSEHYDAMSSYMETASCPVSIGFYRVFRLKRGFLRADFGCNARFCTESSMRYVAREDDTIIRDGLVIPDYEYLSSDVAEGMLSLMYALELKNRRFLSFVASGSSSVVVGQPEHLSRTSFSLGLGFNF